MKRTFNILFLFCFSLALQAQKSPQPPVKELHQSYLDLLKNAKDSTYNRILADFDKKIKSSDDPVQICIQKCRFLENALYDEYDEYNPNEDLCIQFLDSLLNIYKGHPDLMIYRMKFSYGDSAIAFGNRIFAAKERDTNAWKDKPIWQVYQALCDSYSLEDSALRCVKYAEMAMRLNDTLDLTYTIANGYKKLGLSQKGLLILLSRLDSTGERFTLQRKGNLLLELNDPINALKVFRWLEKDTSNALYNYQQMAEALMKNEHYAEARIYLLKKTTNDWSKAEGLRKLFDFDLQYSTIDTAAATYYKMTAAAFMSDAVGIKRLRLYLKAPMLSWTVMDGIRILLLASFVFLIIVFPYLWILPIHYIGTYRKQKGYQKPVETFRWGLRHFWYIVALVLICDVFFALIFSHDVFLDLDNETQGDVISQSLANSTLFSLVSYAIATFILLRKDDIQYLWGQLRGKMSAVWSGLGFSLLLRLGLGIYVFIFKLFGVNLMESTTEASVVDNISSVNQFYSPWLGFAFVVLIVPFYEEIIFRGIFLSSMEKHLPFFWANVIQAAAFGAIHFDLKFLPFYIGMGILSGYQKRKTRALSTSISMHMFNNLFAFFGILARS